MRYGESLALQSGTMVVAVRPGAALGICYEAGTVGVIQSRHDAAGDVERQVRFTRNLTVDFSFFALQNWEVLARCGQCGASEPQTALSPCEKCPRVLLCRNCTSKADGY